MLVIIFSLEEKSNLQPLTFSLLFFLSLDQFYNFKILCHELKEDFIERNKTYFNNFLEN